MPQITVKGHHFNFKPITNSFTRRAVQFKNNIHNSLRKIGLTEDDVEVPLEAAGMKKLPASAEWYFDGTRCYFSHSQQNKYVDNLYIVSKIIDAEVKELLDEKINSEEFKMHFAEDDNIDEQRAEARKLLGVDEDCQDIAIITKAYKSLSKKHHPDMPGGDLDIFKSLNNAHLTLKRELA